MSNNLTWQQKAEALNALSPVEIKMGTNGHWYVTQHVEIKQGPCLTGLIGRAANPHDALLEHWRIATELPADQYLVLDGWKKGRRARRWNGFMWAEVKEPTEAGVSP